MHYGSKLVRMVPWVAGVCLLVATLLGARHLLDAEGPPGHAPGNGQPANPPPAGGVTVLGEVDSDPTKCPVGPPAVAALLTVQKVLVEEGQTVAAGTALVQFDDTLVRPKVAQAQAAVDAARSDLLKANLQKALNPLKLKLQQLAVTTADGNEREATRGYDVAQQAAEKVLAAPKFDGKAYTPEEKAQIMRDNPDLMMAAARATNLKAAAEKERQTYALMVQGLPALDADIAAATAKVAGTQAALAEAQAAVDACLVKAKVDGVVEQILATAGMTYGPASRDPVLWLIPAGRRVVRAEVEAEFAHRLVGKEQKKVSVTDGSNFALSYEGKVLRLGTAFLTKRSQSGGLVLNTVKVVECLIEVADPTPAGKPPLRVGQPVRVVFP